MSDTVQPIVWFKDVGKEDVGVVGGKGANLGELTRAQIPVPPGFVVTAETYFQFIERSGLRPQIQAILAGVDHNQSAALQQAAERIKELIRSAPVPEEIAARIREAYRELGGGPVAVRSSATAEDMAEASFAGQQSTFLNVVGEENVVDAVRACWASLFEARAIFYRQEAGFDHLQVSIAVPVQKMVQSECSGVMFTVEPVTSDRSKITIEAIFGLGEGIVSGQVTPDLYVVDKETLRILEKTVAEQDRKLVRSQEAAAAGDHEANNVWVEVPAAERRAQKLTDEQILALAEIGRRVEAHYGHPQDIEWGIEGGQIYLLQSRPVTTVRDHEGGEEDGSDETAPVLLRGSAASPGVDVGRVKIVLHPSEIDRVQPGDVLVSEMTTPDFVPAMKRAAAIVTDRGGRTCHAAIVSRELGIPCVVGTGTATQVLKPEQEVTVDGSLGRVYQGRAEARLAWAAREKERRQQAANIQTRTRLYVNLAEPELAEVVAQRNVDGVGLLRAEFMIAQIGEHPRSFIDSGRGEEFTRRLAEGLEMFARAFHPRPVTYRTTDFKTNEYRGLRGGDRYEEQEENPMIGYRGASRYIREPEVFRLEVEAIKQVRRQYRNLNVMIPFVRTPEELAAVKALLERFGLRRGEDDFKLWMMAEIPSNVFLLDRFIDVGIDGISIGSNDLTQLTLGIDRDNGRFATEFDERNEAVLLALQTLITTAKRRGVTVSICGQAPSFFPELTERLVEWGITSISVSPDVIERTREIIAKAEAKLLQPAG
ncbi:MAG TPA: phosphoenolpyruvate synthase [Dehalococcoidia bacterium]